jgi:hypothetical protein
VQLCALEARLTRARMPASAAPASGSERPLHCEPGPDMQVQTQRSEPKAMRRNPLRVMCAVRAELTGHEGPVTAAAWLPPPCTTRGAAPLSAAADAPPHGGWRLASASDDRSVRLFALPDLDLAVAAAADGPSGPVAAPELVAPMRSLWGHTGRVWSCAAAGPELLASGAEDGSARLWCLRMGRQLAVLQVCGRGATHTRVHARIHAHAHMVMALLQVGGRAQGGSGQGKVGEGPLGPPLLWVRLLSGARSSMGEPKAWAAVVRLLQGHQGRGVWRCVAGGVAASSSGSQPASTGTCRDVLVTAGADGAIRLWRLAEHLRTGAGRPSPTRPDTLSCMGVGSQ